MASIVFNFSFILHDQLVDLALVCLHLRDSFNPHTWFRPRRHRGSPRRCSPRITRSVFRGMMTLVQIRERKERRQQHDLKTLPICDVKPSRLVERPQCKAKGGGGRTCSGCNPISVPCHSVCERAVPRSRPQVLVDQASVSCNTRPSSTRNHDWMEC